jgi:sRNA-binding protein
MDEVEHLRQELRTAQEREEAARGREKAATEHAKAAQRRADTAEELSKHTTLPMFLELCHKLFSKPLRVQTNRSLTHEGLNHKPPRKEASHIPAPMARLSTNTIAILRSRLFAAVS